MLVCWIAYSCEQAKLMLNLRVKKKKMYYCEFPQVFLKRHLEYGCSLKSSFVRDKVPYLEKVWLPRTPLSFLKCQLTVPLSLRNMYSIEKNTVLFIISIEHFSFAVLATVPLTLHLFNLQNPISETAPLVLLRAVPNLGTGWSTGDPEGASWRWQSTPLGP